MFKFREINIPPWSMKSNSSWHTALVLFAMVTNGPEVVDLSEAGVISKGHIVLLPVDNYLVVQMVISCVPMATHQDQLLGCSNN